MGVGPVAADRARLACLCEFEAFGPIGEQAVVVASCICLRNVFIAASCIKLGNIPENSLTQAHQRDQSPHDQQPQSNTDRLRENSGK